MKTTSDLSWENFELGFWHPFGSHGRESLEEIINRKRRETENNGWTLWSFQYRRPESLNEWYRQLTLAKPHGPVVVFCSTGGSAVDPDRPGSLTRTADCREYQLIGCGDLDWRPVPPLIRVPHPFGPTKEVASAFVIRRVHHPVKLLQRPFVEWFKGGKWDERKIPTRPEFLIRRGGKIAMPNVSAVLELQSPYLAVVKRDLGTQSDNASAANKRLKDHKDRLGAASTFQLLKKREVVLQKENFGRALAIQAKSLRDAAKQKRETVRKWRARDGNAEAICNGCGYSEGWMQADGVKRPTRLLRCPACGSREVRLEWRPFR